MNHEVQYLIMKKVSKFYYPHFENKILITSNSLIIYGKMINIFYIEPNTLWLSNWLKLDNVLHLKQDCSAKCNTLSRSHYVDCKSCQAKTDLCLREAKVLDDRTPFPADGLLDPVGATIFGQSRVLQQFYAQRPLVHACLDSQLWLRRSVVPRKYWLLQCRITDPNPCQVDRTQPERHDSRSTRKKTQMSLPCRLGGIISKRPGATAKIRPFIPVSGRRSGHGIPPALHPETESALVAGADGGFGTCGVHSLSGSWISTAGQCCFPTHRRSYKGRSNSSAFRAAQVKKKDLNNGAQALLALGKCLSRLYQETLPAALFAKPPLIRFYPDKNVCSCGCELGVQKTRYKNVLCMTGPFVAHETVLHCKQCHRVFKSQALERLVGKSCNVGWDVLVFVGQSLYQRHCTTDQVRRELQTRNVGLSLSEIEYLGRKFIIYLALAHRDAAPRINQAMQMHGGYILHLDATHEADAPALMSGMDGLSRIVLANVKIPSEHSDHIAKFLRQIKRDYGDPVACVHDMGGGICKAVDLVFPKARDFICHFHFLRDIGKDLLGPAYDQLRKVLRKHAATTTLSRLIRQAREHIVSQSVDSSLLASAIQEVRLLDNMAQMPLLLTYLLALWAQQGKKIGDGYGFPFDRPLLDFADRLSALDGCLSQLQPCLPDKDRIGNRLISKLSLKVSNIVQDPAFCQATEELQWRSRLFDNLRNKMRIAEPGGHSGLNDDGTHRAMKSIRKGVELFRSRLDKDRKLANDALCRKVAKQIDKYSDKLFADPIQVSTPQGILILYPQRTNNMLERFFRALRRAHRRKTGDNSMSRVLHAMLADTPLVKNLQNPEYMEILLNGKESLEQLFAEIDNNRYTEALKTKPEADRILPGFRELIKKHTLLDSVVRIIDMEQMAA